MSDVMTGANTFNFTSIDNVINEVRNRNHQFILRIFADYPSWGNGQTVFIPSYLVGKVNMCNYTNYGGGSSPDYDNPLLVSAMVSLINALAVKYDGDIRVAIIQTGLLGHWGEQHTQSPCNYASAATVTTILTAYKNAFKKTKLMVRYADSIGNIQTANLGMGYHDDSFAQDTLTAYSYFFYQRMINANATNQWMQYPIGGQVRPELWTCIFGANITQSCASATAADASMIPEDINLCISTVHASWQWDQGLFQNANTMSSADYNRALAASANMGCSMQVVNTTVMLYQVSGNWKINVSATIKNQGVAPFYYDLSVQLTIQNTNYQMSNSTSLSYLQPNSVTTVTLNNIAVTVPITKMVLGLVSQDTYIPISWANSQVTSNGQLVPV